MVGYKQSGIRLVELNVTTLVGVTVGVQWVGCCVVQGSDHSRGEKGAA